MPSCFNYRWEYLGAPFNDVAASDCIPFVPWQALISTHEAYASEVLAALAGLSPSWFESYVWARNDCLLRDLDVVYYL